MDNILRHSHSAPPPRSANKSGKRVSRTSPGKLGSRKRLEMVDDPVTVDELLNRNQLLQGQVNRLEEELSKVKDNKRETDNNNILSNVGNCMLSESAESNPKPVDQKGLTHNKEGSITHHMDIIDRNDDSSNMAGSDIARSMPNCEEYKELNHCDLLLSSDQQGKNTEAKTGPYLNTCDCCLNNNDLKRDCGDISQQLEEGTAANSTVCFCNLLLAKAQEEIKKLTQRKEYLEGRESIVRENWAVLKQKQAQFEDMEKGTGDNMHEGNTESDNAQSTDCCREKTVMDQGVTTKNELFSQRADHHMDSKKAEPCMDSKHMDTDQADQHTNNGDTVSEEVTGEENDKLTERENAIKSKEVLLEEREEYVEKREKIIKLKELKIKEKESKLKTKETKLRERENNIERMENLLDDKLEKIGEREKKLKVKEKQKMSEEGFNNEKEVKLKGKEKQKMTEERLHNDNGFDAQAQGAEEGHSQAVAVCTGSPSQSVALYNGDHQTGAGPSAAWAAVKRQQEKVNQGMELIKMEKELSVKERKKMAADMVDVIKGKILMEKEKEYMEKDRADLEKGWEILFEDQEKTDREKKFLINWSLDLRRKSVELDYQIKRRDPKYPSLMYNSQPRSYSASSFITREETITVHSSDDRFNKEMEESYRKQKQKYNSSVMREQQVQETHKIKEELEKERARYQQKVMVDNQLKEDMRITIQNNVMVIKSLMQQVGKMKALPPSKAFPPSQALPSSKALPSSQGRK